jgi:hypothetical protein
MNIPNRLLLGLVSFSCKVCHRESSGEFNKLIEPGGSEYRTAIGIY